MWCWARWEGLVLIRHWVGRDRPGQSYVECSRGTKQSTLFPWYVAICEGADLTFLSLMLCAVQGRVMVPPSVAVKDSVLLVSSCPLLLFSGKEWIYKFVSISGLSNCEYVAGLDLLQTLNPIFINNKVRSLEWEFIVQVTRKRI